MIYQGSLHKFEARKLGMSETVGYTQKKVIKEKKTQVQDDVGLLTVLELFGVVKGC